MEKVLVTGAGGLLGTSLVNRLSKKYIVTPTHKSQLAYSEFHIVDITDKDEVSRIFRKVMPKIVVHAAAATDVDKCEIDRDWASKINTIGTKNVAQASVMIECKLVYISTDYVFDGNKGAYQEEDKVNPINHYGSTKLKGEEFVKDICEDYIIARTSAIFGWNPRKTNFATWILDSLTAGKKTSVVDDHFDSPTHALDLSEILQTLIEIDAHGTYHTTCGERINRYEFALLIARTFGFEEKLVEPIKMRDLKKWIAKRPTDSSLQISKLMRKGIQPNSLAASLERMKSSRKTSLD